MNEVAIVETGTELDALHATNLEEYVTFKIENQLFGISVLQVQDILKPIDIAFVPLAPPEVRGSINLRGRIVTVIDVRVRLGLSAIDAEADCMGVTVENQNELYTLLVDEIGEVLNLDPDHQDKVPGTMDPIWREFAESIFQLEGELMIVLDVAQLLRSKEGSN
ncbi:MAG: chemotaxis protein CheW [Rhodospirillaceae bacterium]|jgi:purine-binding chemotaxis protein CheW|nr:chemotaxis protein CheW [Rhodospirillaceae bacterium]MBT4937664.1 chemotaxis protein CheW [Rhodospirillaceae bacterium]MBT5939320.1 chemotaxis protein CheW [Rhodospirillaceae bacterium]MBT7266513.1 chemotaxis protein CheW [Rhodospirillaceae bacterium]